MPFLLLTFLAVSSSLKSRADEGSDTYLDSKTPTSYCGLYCFYVAAHSFGIDLELENLIQEKYLNGEVGSSSDDLVQLAKDNGLLAIKGSGLTLDDLEFSTNPMVLHVRTPGNPSYNHWILFLGFDGTGKSKVFDPPSGSGSLSKANLLAIWDGTAIAISLPSRRAWSLPISIKLVLFSLCSFGLIALFGRVLKRVWLIGTVSALVSICVFVLPEGFFWNPDAIQNVSSAHVNLSLPATTGIQLKKMLGDNAVILIDARSAEAYHVFHLPNAINIPIGSNEIELSLRLAELSKIAKDKRVVTYCQSIRCGWADKVGSLIYQRTGIPVSVFRDGVNGWTN